MILRPIPAAAMLRATLAATGGLLGATLRARAVVATLGGLHLGLNTTPQATDLLITLGQGGDAGAWGGLAIGAGWLGWNAWFWARFAQAGMAGDAAARWVARGLGASALLIVAAGLWTAARGVPQDMLVSMGPLGSGEARLRVAAGGLALAAAGILLAGIGRRGGSLAPEFGPGAWGMLSASVIVGVAGLAAFGLDPLLAAAAMPAATTILFAASALMCGGTLLAYLGRRTRVPVLALLLAGAALLAVARDRDWLADNHDVRRVAGPLPERVGLEAAFARFLTTTGPGFGAAPVPVVLVSAGGGGIAAAFWTATVLGDLIEESPALGGQVFALSGVSGGALGLLATVAAGDGTTLCREPGAVPAVLGLRACLQRALAGDFLGPAVGSMLYPDLFQRFVPIHVFADRAVALELAWEARWRAVFGTDRLAAPLLDLWPPARPWPALLLNGTSFTTGERLITSNLVLGRGVGGVGSDLLARLGADVPASTAVNTSARFPYLGPLGTLRPAGGGPAVDAVADGGYFENLGATTVLEVLDVLDAAARREGARVRFVVLQIVSDPEALPAGDPLAMAARPAGTLLPRGLVGPAAILLRTRSARGTQASEALARRVLALGGVYVPVRLGQSPTGRTAPLGWSLSTTARGVIDAQWTPACRDRLLAAAGFAPHGPAAAPIAGGATAATLDVPNMMWSGANCPAVGGGG